MSQQGDFGSRERDCSDLSDRRDIRDKAFPVPTVPPVTHVTHVTQVKIAQFHLAIRLLTWHHKYSLLAGANDERI